MASKDTRLNAQFTRDNLDREARALGHVPTWAPAPDCWRKGRAYYFVGTCENCAGNAHAGAAWSSSSSVVDIRHQPCGGPGTAILTEIEQDRCSELVAEAVADFGRAVAVIRKDAMRAVAGLN